MELIAPHDHADLDAFAAAVAAQKLFPAAAIVMSPSTSRTVRDFLAIHRERFPFLLPSEIDASTATKLIVVDCRRASRFKFLGALLDRVHAADPAVEVIVFDHHPDQHDDLRATVHSTVSEVGSTTSLLVEILKRTEIDIDEVEATLFLLGIYADTGALTYSTTTALDAEAVAWLLRQGADLAVVNRYLRLPFSGWHRTLLQSMLSQVQQLTVRGMAIGFVALEVERILDGVSEVVSEGLALHQDAAWIAIVHHADRDKGILVARARTAGFDVLECLADFGGGGHPQAASATYKGMSLVEISTKVRRCIGQMTTHAKKVKELMTSSVVTIDYREKLALLELKLRQSEQSGAIVLKAGNLFGIVSWRDLQRVKRRNTDWQQNTVAQIMAHPVRTTSPEQNAESAAQQMTQLGIGRLPVLEENRLVGMITRRDILRWWYGTKAL